MTNVMEYKNHTEIRRHVYEDTFMCRQKVLYMCCYALCDGGTAYLRQQ